MKKIAIKYLLAIIVILLLCSIKSWGQEKRDSVVVSLITCWPGSDVYELCGHEALRVRGVTGGIPVDTVWNYGVFDFNAPNFIYRFVKGETDYLLAGYPFEWFLPEYQTSGRKVVEQDLNLTQDEAMRLVGMLREEGKPENRTYRYNYVRDNCATRIIDRIDSVAGKRVVYPDNVNYGTFRKAMRHYHRDYPWYQFGIDLALGSGIDIPISGREEMFIPVEMAEKAAEAKLPDGRPLVSATRVLNQGVPDATLPPTPWYLTPLTFAWLIFALVAFISFWMWKRSRIIRGIYSIWFGICGLAGCLIAFLVVVSEHEATSPNVLILWLNPLQLLFAFSVWSRRARIVSYIMAYYNIVILASLLLVWGFQHQSANPAIFPLMGTTLILAAAFAFVAPGVYSSNKTGQNPLNKLGSRFSTSDRGEEKRRLTSNRRKR